MFSVFVPSESSLKKAVIEDLTALPENAVWIDLFSPSAAEDKAVERLAGIAIPNREDMQEIDISRRLYIENGARYMTATLMCHSDTDMPPNTAGAFIPREHTTGTVRYDLPKLAAFNFVLDDVLEGGINASLGLDGHGKSLSFVLLEMPIEIPV